jgi:glycosyl transferase family 2
VSLASALGQREVRHEVIVVDDGSEDDTPPYLATVSDTRLRVVRHRSTRGLAAARNAGISAARAPWVAFLDDDDLWAPDKLVSQLRAVAASPGARWCAVGSVTVDRQFRITGGKRTPRPGAAARLLRTQNAVPGGGSGVMAEASLLAAVGAFDPRFSLAADWDLWIRLAGHSPPACVDRPLVGYVLHGANLSTAAKGYEEELLALERKYRESGPPVSSDIPRSALAVRAGRRAEAVALLVRAGLRRPGVEPFARAAVIGAGHRVEQAVRRAQSRALTSDWHDEAEQWLRDVRPTSVGGCRAVP